MSMEKATRDLLEYFHFCLICKNYIRPRKRKMSQTERHAQQVKNNQGSTLLIPSISYRTLCSVPWRSVLTDLGPQRGMALSKGPDGKWISFLFPWGSYPPALIAYISNSIAINGETVFQVGSNSKLPELFWSSFTTSLLLLKYSWWSLHVTSVSLPLSHFH